MKKLLPGSILASLLLMFSSAASADSFIHLWTCMLGDDTSQDDMMQWSQDWLEAAQSMDGGEEMGPDPPTILVPRYLPHPGYRSD